MEYRNALEQAIMYIENHLKEEIKVEDVAREAGYSYYHLTRLFAAILGESVGSYIKKRRLSDAAKQLLYTEKRIIDIGMDAGFQSPEAFSRAFKCMYQSSPALYRKNRLDLFIGSKPAMDPQHLDHLTRNVTPQPRFAELPDILVAGIRGETTLKDNVLPQLWAKFHTMRDRIPDQLPQARGFGICEACGQGNSLYTMNDEVLFQEVVGIEVSSLQQISPPFVKKRLKGGKYAVFTHTGSLTKLSWTFEYIWGTWFFETDQRLDDREDFELYDERFLGYDHPDSQLDLYIPLR